MVRQELFTLKTGICATSVTSIFCTFSLARAQDIIMQTCTMCSEDEVRLWGISAQVQVNGVSVDRGKSRVQLDAAHRCSRRKPSSRPAAQLRPPRLAPPRADVPASSRLLPPRAALRRVGWSPPVPSRRDSKAVLRSRRHRRK